MKKVKTQLQAWIDTDVNVRQVIDEHIAVSEYTVLCQCGGHYKVSGKKQHELAGIDRKWQLTANAYTQLPNRKQTPSTLI